MILENKEFWIDQWNCLNNTKVTQNAYSKAGLWDKMSLTYGKNDDLCWQLQREEIVNELFRKGIIFPGAKVLDIGCGPGSFAIPFAEIGCFVTCIDISEGMLKRFAEELPENLKGKVKLMQMDWHRINPVKEDMAGKYDLVFANMTPAIASAVDLNNLSVCSKGWCHFAGWYGERTNDLMDEVKAILNIGKGKEFKGNAVIVLNLLLSQGYLPELKFTKRQWTHFVSIEKRVETMSEVFANEIDMSEEALKEELKKVLSKLANEKGEVIESTSGTIAKIRWSVKDKN